MQEEYSNYTPSQENIISSTSELDTFFYCDENGKPIFKTKEIYKKEKKIVCYPYSISIEGSIKPKRIQTLEFLGWEKIEDIPNDFKAAGKYGLKTLRAKSFFNALYYKYKEANKYTIGLNIQNRFKATHISLNWADLKGMLGDLSKEKIFYDKEKMFLINRNLSKINNTVGRLHRPLPSGELKRFLNRFNSYDKINADDLNALSSILDLIPPTLINTTSNFIHSKEKINKIYIEDLIDRFERLMLSKKDNEKQWQNFFGDHTWVLSHLFPFEVILRKKEAYVGGKTLENDEGRIIDFLFENGFKDNYALLEVKTHKKELLKKHVYRHPNAFAMTDDLSGGISQCLDQKDAFLKDFGHKNPSFDPKCILIIGTKGVLTTNQKTCFELLRSEQKNVEIVTFDEVLTKLKGLVKVLNLTGGR